jgi:hypothetical protein
MNMVTVILSVVLTFSVTGTVTFAESVSESIPEIKVYLDEQELEFDTSPEIVNNRTFVPMRSIFEALGADMEWSDSRRDVTASVGLEEINIKIGSTVAIHNTEVDTLDAAPYIKDNRTMLPLRYLSESLGYNVDWNPSERTVYINSEKDEEQTDSDTDNKYGILGHIANLSYDDAISKSVKESSSCKNARLSLKQAEQQSIEFNNLNSINLTLTQLKNRKSLQLLNGWSEKNVIVTEEQTGYSIKNATDTISLKIAEIYNQQKSLDFKNKTYDINKLKYEQGLISLKTLNGTMDEIVALQKSISEGLTELNGLYISLCGKTDIDYSQNLSESSQDTGDIYDYIIENDIVPEFSIDYQEIGSVDIEQFYKEQLEIDPYIWYVENSEKNAEFALDMYEYNMGGKSYTLTKYDLQQASMNTDSTKKNLKNTLYSRYNQMVQIENNIDMLEDQLDILRNNVDTVRTLYEQGMQSKYSLEEVLQNEMTLQYNILNLKVSHEQLRSIFDKPYLAPEYMS